MSKNFARGAVLTQAFPFIKVLCATFFQESSRNTISLTNFLSNSSRYRLEVLRAVLAEGADEVLGELVALVDVTADLADVALLAVRFGLGLNVCVVIDVGHGLLIREDSRLAYRADEHSVCVKVNVLLDLERHKGIDISGKHNETVIRAQGSAIRELINVSSADKSERLEYAEGSLNRQTVDVHLAAHLDNVVRIVLLVDGDRNSVGHIGDLSYGVHDKSVVLLTVVGCDHVESVADVEERGGIVLVSVLRLKRDILAAKLLSKSVKLLGARLVQRRHDLYVVFGKGDVLGVLKHTSHYLSRKRRPASVLDKRNGLVLEVSLGKMLDKTDIYEEDVLNHLVTVKAMKNFGCLGYKAGENRYSYPDLTDDKVKALFDVLHTMAGYVFVDCTDEENDLISQYALGMADEVIMVISPDLKSMVYVSSNENNHSDRAIKVLNINEHELYSPIDDVRTNVKNISFVWLVTSFV